MRKLPILLTPDAKHETKLWPGDWLMIIHGKEAHIAFYRDKVDEACRLQVDHHQAARKYATEPIHCPNLDSALTYMSLIAMANGYEAVLEHEDGNRLTFRLYAKQHLQDDGDNPILQPGFNDPTWKKEVLCTSFVNGEGLPVFEEQGCGCTFHVKRTGLITRSPFPNSPHVYADCPNCTYTVDLGPLVRFNFDTELPTRE